jgi:hypothetical protein
MIITAVFQEVAELLKRTGSPAPQRSRIIRQGTLLFRQRLNLEIDRLLGRTRKERQLGYEALEAFQRNEQLKLPFLALHFLMTRLKQDVKGAYSILEAAVDLRDDPEVAQVRDLLGEYEQSDSPWLQLEKLTERIERRVRGEHSARAIMASSRDIPFSLPEILRRLGDALERLLDAYAPGRIFLSIVEGLAADPELEERLFRLLPFSVNRE